jgi:TolA-binding protein
VNDPQRLEERASVALKRMLTAARHEKPPAAALQRTLVSLGVGAAAASMAMASAKAAGTVAASSTAATAPAAITAASAWGTASVLKWTVIGLVGGLSVIGVAHQATRLGETPAATEHAETVAPPAAANISDRPETRSGSESTGATADAPAREEAAQERPSASFAPLHPAANPASGATHHANLKSEVAVLDRAREALRKGQSTTALEALDEYARRFKAGRLGLEAQYLRMETSLQRGDAAGARAIASRLLQSSPSGPHAARARAVLEGANP